MTTKTREAVELIFIPMSDAEDLHWWANGEDEGEMQGPSIQGAIQGVLERGGFVQNGRAPEGISARQIAAAARAHKIRDRLRSCTPDEQYILTQAFRRHDLRGGLNVFGTYPGALFGCQTVYREFKAAGGVHLERMGDWLRELVSAPELKKGRERERARLMLEYLRETAALELRCALIAYGAEVHGVRVPTTVSLREVGKALEMNHETAKREVERRGITPEPGSRGKPSRIRTRQLRSRWPEAFRKLAS
jgi:hypothetical protein